MHKLTDSIAHAPHTYVRNCYRAEFTSNRMWDRHSDSHKREAFLASSSDDLIGDTALVDPVGQTDVASFTPGLAPAVADPPVFNSFVGTISSELDAVVKISIGMRAVDRVNSVGVGVPVGSIDTDGHRANVHDLVPQQGFILAIARIHASRNSISPGGEMGNNFGSGILTLLTSGGSVGIRGLRLKTVGNHILEGSGSVSTSASVVAGVAVNKLLLRESGEAFAAHELSALSLLSGGKCPAGAALSLVLDSSHSTKSSVIAISC
jgi:hypothetical protein